MIKITFPDGSVREYENGVTGLQIAESISSRLAQDVVSCGANGKTVELNRQSLKTQLSLSTNGMTKKVSAPFGTLLLTLWQKLCKNCFLAHSSA